MDIIKLRILTEKSQIKFGKFSDSTVQNLINLGHTCYLRWIYYNMNGISFTNNVLNKIHISGNNKIEKPGKDLGKFKKLSLMMTAIIYKKYGNIGYIKRYSHLKKEYKMEVVRNKKMRSKSYYKKSVLQAKNQGHYK